mmetsp:Transcript_39959/g.125036  ORF Transcript_39959/g.125036 Transcript_39959/m.125036 type:complete len:290 (-) Transcript_39959:367-1236(-)
MLRFAVLVAALAAGARAQLCAQSSVDAAGKSGMALLQYALDTGTWEKLAKEKNLDPYEPNETFEISIPCKYFGSTFCGAQASKCKKSKVKMTLKDILGLASLHVDKLEATEVHPTDGTCSYSESGNLDAAAINCGYEGVGDAEVSLPAGKQIQVDVRNMELRVQCRNTVLNKSWWETPFKSSKVTCTMGSGAQADANLNFCAATCNESLLSSSFSHAAFSDFTFSNYDDTLQCDASGVPSDVSDKLMEAVESAIIGMFDKPVQDILNKMLDKELKGGFPTKCEAPASPQ